MCNYINNLLEKVKEQEILGWFLLVNIAAWSKSFVIAYSIYSSILAISYHTQRTYFYGLHDIE